MIEIKKLILVLGIALVTGTPLIAQTESTKIAPSQPQTETMSTQDLSYQEPDEWTWQGVALGAHIGTLGLGGDLTVSILEVLNVRGGVNWADFSFNGDVGDVKYNIGADLLSFPLVVDVHPFKNNFRISAGVLFNESSKLKLDAAPDKNTEIGDVEYTPAQIGILTGEATFTKNAAPYVGIGFGNAVKMGTSWSFMFDLGVVFQSYEVELSSRNGTMSDNPIFLENLAKEEQKAQDDLDKYEIYPVLNIGMAYHF